MSHVFISYSKIDRDYARKLADKLLAEGFDVWIDDRIDYGEDWELAIFEAIDTCDAFVVVMTPDSYKSKWVRRECNYAEKRNKPPFPILLEGEEFPRYGLIQYADVIDGTVPPEDFYSRLAQNAIRGAKPGKDVTVQVETELAKASAFPVTAILEEPKDKNVAKVSISSNIVSDVSSILPSPFEWCEIPAGSILVQYIESGGTWGRLVESRRKIVPFLLAKYPITNKQYQIFIDAPNGYSNHRWWSFSPEAAEWRADNPQSDKTAFDGDDLPRANVSWYEAIAFCRWLTGEIGSEMTLPTEWEWQHAAQGWNGKRRTSYPWGNDFYSTYCNTSERGPDKLTPVTQYVDGASPYGVMDMVGNIREWCLNLHHDPLEKGLKGEAKRAIRGCGFDMAGIRYAECDMRDGEAPHIRVRRLGFRIAHIAHPLK